MGSLSRDPRSCVGLRVGVYGSAGAPWPHAGFAALSGASVQFVRASDVQDGRLAELDVFVMPGGGRQAMHGLLQPLGEEGVSRIRDFVEEGGTYLSSCAGSVLPLALDGAAADLHPLAGGMRLTDVAMANPGDATLGGLASPGVGVIRVRVDSDVALAEGVADEVELVHYNGPFFDVSDGASTATPFVWPEASTDRFTPAERFLSRGDPAPEDPTFPACVAAHAAGAIVAPYGDGRAILFGSHPEFGLGPMLLGWGNGAQLLHNALTSAPRRHGPGASGPMTAEPEHRVRSVDELAGMTATRLRTVADRFDRLAAFDSAAWLDDDAAPQFLGRRARETWRETREAASALARLLAVRFDDWSSSLHDVDRHWFDDAPRPDQDVGAMGLLQLAEQIEVLVSRALEVASDGPRPLAHAYDGLEDHPFHLAVGSYLSGAGLLAGTALQAAALAADRDLPLDQLATWLFVDEDDA